MKPIDVTEESFPREVLLSDAPVVVDFHAHWCQPCKMLGPVLDKLAAKYDGKVKVAKVDVDTESGLAARFGVRGVPTVVFVKGGKVVDQVVGLLPPPQLEAKFESLTR